MYPACTPPWGNRTGKLRGLQERRLRSDALPIATSEAVGFPSGNGFPALTDPLQGSAARLVLPVRSYQQYVTLIYCAIVSIDYQLLIADLNCHYGMVGAAIIRLEAR